VRQGVLFEKTMDTGFDFIGDGARSSWPRSIDKSLSAFSSKALDPFSEGGIGEIEGFRSRFDGMIGHDLPDGLGATKDTVFLACFIKSSKVVRAPGGNWLLRWWLG
jgi:hypothetical protein